MQDQHSRRHIPLGIVAGLSGLIVVTGSAVAWWSWTSASRNAPTPTATQLSRQDSQSNQTRPDGQVAPPGTAARSGQASQPNAVPVPNASALQVYWLKGSGSKIELTAAPIKVSSTGSTSTLLQSAFQQLLEGPSSSAFTTTIPRDTRLNSLSVREDGIHVDLSREFTQGGGSASMTARVAQVLYTATSLNPNAQVWLAIDGKPLKTLGGEGLIIDQPTTRKSFNQDFSL